MRVAIDYTSAIRQGGGIARYTRRLVGALAELDATSRYVLFSAGRDRTGKTWPPNFSLRSLPIKDRHLAMVWQRMCVPIPIELFTGWVHVFHSPDFVLPPVARARTVLTVHDLSFIRHPECFHKTMLAYAARAVPRSVARADVVLADSESARQDLLELLHVPQDRLFVVYPAVESRFNPQEDSGTIRAVMRRYGIGCPFILGLGTLQPRKNFPRLIRAYDLLRREHNIPHQLVIAGGKGWLYDDIDETIDELGLHEHVLLPGFVADEDLPALYSAADVFAFPSLYEGFGIPVLEAMACGTPVVTTPVSSLPEAAGEAALFVSPKDIEGLADALWQLIDDSALRDELRGRGFQQAKRFTWAGAAKKVLRIYHSLAS
ncbi:MAG TPA: glycosyltransferase family 1 protein [Anaerolineae bacterium]|nr:glycosyltransferase family 1 protein [Anaerolineae bacterium]